LNERHVFQKRIEASKIFLGHCQETKNGTYCQNPL
jgi:hypothetical protein